MDVIDFLGWVSRFALRAFIVIAPVLAWQWVALWARPWRRRAGGLGDPTIVAGMMVGFAILVVTLPPETLTWDAIVPVGGFWDLGLADFLEFARNVMVHGPGVLLYVLRSADEPRNLQAWLALASALWLIRVFGVWLSRTPQGAGRFLLAELATFAASVLGTIYLGPLVLWSINQLNFWLFLVVILLIQDYRYDEPPLFGRLVGAVGNLHLRRHHEVPFEAMPVPDPD